MKGSARSVVANKVSTMPQIRDSARLKSVAYNLIVAAYKLHFSGGGRRPAYQWFMPKNIPRNLGIGQSFVYKAQSRANNSGLRVTGRDRVIRNNTLYIGYS
jgi:hypothetical protein